MADYGSTFGGQSAVNPGVQTNPQPWIDAAYKAWETKANPIFQQQQQDYEQRMINQGIPVGGEAYDKSFKSLLGAQNDAQTQATFDSIGFGLGAQNQEFGQGLAKSQLANSLLQAMWGDETARYGIDSNEMIQQNRLGQEAQQFAQQLAEQSRQFNSGLQLDRDKLDLQSQQFGDTLGFNYADLYGNLGLAYDQLGQRANEFNSTLDYNYWDRGNQFDYMYDRAASDDMRWGADQNRQDFYDTQNSQRYMDALIMSLLGGPAPDVPTFDPTGAYNGQIGGLSSGNNSSNSWFDNFLSFG